MCLFHPFIHSLKLFKGKVKSKRGKTKKEKEKETTKVIQRKEIEKEMSKRKLSMDEKRVRMKELFAETVKRSTRKKPSFHITIQLNSFSFPFLFSRKTCSR